jgi:hypothetical protein
LAYVGVCSIAWRSIDSASAGAVQLDEQRAQQRLQVDVARVIGEPSTDARLGADEIARVDQRDRSVEVGFRGQQRHRCLDLPAR